MLEFVSAKSMPKVQKRWRGGGRREGCRMSVEIEARMWRGRCQCLDIYEGIRRRCDATGGYNCVGIREIVMRESDIETRVGASE